jgi:5-methyltetrahydrofolate--homocysteine methyltransferase
MNRLVEALHSGRVLVMDGAMGTELQRLGLRDGECSALWNITHPEQVAAVHAAYLEAGAEVLLTNTFMATPEGLVPHGLQQRIDEIWTAALANTRAFHDPKPMVLADIGPCSNLTPRLRSVIQHYGRTADGHLFETWSAEPAVARAVMPASQVELRPRLPLLVSFAYHRSMSAHELTASARDVAEVAEVRMLFGKPIAALGANCGRDIDMDDLLEIVRVYREHTDLPLFIRPNAGTPKRTASGWQYPRSPEYMADKLWPLLEAGVTMVGGCCGTTPAHIAAFRRVVDEWNAKRAAGR